MANDQRGALVPVGSVVAIVLAVIVAWRSMRPAPVVAATDATAASVRLQSLTPYLAPPADSLALGGVAAKPSAVVLARDPFTAIAERTVSSEHASLSRPTKAEEDKWTVSAILITDSRRAAVINDVLVNLGGELPGGSGTRLTAVESDHVVLTDPRGVRRSVTVLDGTH